MENKQVNVGFTCPANCGATVKLDLAALLSGNRTAVCPVCQKSFTLDEETPAQLVKIKNLVDALNEVQPILRECSIGVATPMGEVKVPYALILTQLKNLVQLGVDGNKVPFTFWTTDVK